MNRERVTWILPEQEPDLDLALSKPTEREGVFPQGLPDPRFIRDKDAHGFASAPDRLSTEAVRVVRQMVPHGMKSHQEAGRRNLGISA